MLMPKPSERIQATAAAECQAHLVRQVAHGAQHRHAVLGALALALQDAIGVALLLGVNQHHATAQFLHRLGTDRHRFDVDAVVGIEADVVQAAKGRRVLVLLANRLSEHIDLDAAGLLGEVLRADDLALVRIERLQHAHGQRTR
jgi:hypothetical protein